MVTKQDVLDFLNGEGCFNKKGPGDLVDLLSSIMELSLCQFSRDEISIALKGLEYCLTDSDLVDVLGYAENERKFVVLQNS